jgi:exocyst complex component 4
MPGLVQSSSENATYTLSSVGSEDRLLGVGKRHRLLVRPNAFHVSLLFQPTLAFLDRISEVLPTGIESAQSSTVILDDFVLKVYLPQLEEKVSLLFHQSVTGLCAQFFRDFVILTSDQARMRSNQIPLQIVCLWSPW